MDATNGSLQVSDIATLPIVDLRRLSMYLSTQVKWNLSIKVTWWREELFTRWNYIDRVDGFGL
jgi:hypothetical protein